MRREEAAPGTIWECMGANEYPLERVGIIIIVMSILQMRTLRLEKLWLLVVQEVK